MVEAIVLDVVETLANKQQERTGECVFCLKRVYVCMSVCVPYLYVMYLVRSVCIYLIVMYLVRSVCIYLYVMYLVRSVCI